MSLILFFFSFQYINFIRSKLASVSGGGEGSILLLKIHVKLTVINIKNTERGWLPAT